MYNRTTQISMKNIISPEKGARFVFFGGKGGIGKSTLTAVTAIWLAEQGYKTLIVSTDLQKSQSDIFEQQIDVNETKIKGVSNLWAINTDLKQNIKKYQLKQIRMMEELLGGVPELEFLKQHWEQDPCCETAAYNQLVEYMNDARFDVIIFDTAPGGHALDMIQWPIKQIGTAYKTIAAKKAQNKDINFLKQILEENERAVSLLKSAQTKYILAMHAEKLPLFETERMAEDLNDFGITIAGIIINQVLPHEACSTDFFKEKWKTQQKYMADAQKVFDKVKIGQVPMLSSEAIGISALRRLANLLYGEHTNKFKLETRIIQKQKVRCCSSKSSCCGRTY